MTKGGRAKLERLIQRLVASDSAGLSRGGVTFLAQRLRYRFGLRMTTPSPPGRPNSAERRYVEQVIGEREARLLARAGVAEEVEAAGGELRS